MLSDRQSNPGELMSETIPVHDAQNTKLNTGTPRWVRLGHLTFALLFLTLVYTGIVLTYSYSGFALMDYELAAVLHEMTGIAISALYIVFMIYTIASGYWRVYRHRWRSSRERMVRAITRAFDASHAGTQNITDRERRFESSTQFLLQFQHVAYLAGIAVLMPLLVMTGLVYLYPDTMPETILGQDGLWALALAHYVAGLLGVLFLLIHVYISTIAGFRRIFFGR